MSNFQKRLTALEQAVFGTAHNHIVQTPDPVLHALKATYNLPRLRLHILRYLLVNDYAPIGALEILSEDVVGTRAQNPLGNIRSQITQMRRVLEPDDIFIETWVGHGWRMSEQSKAKLREACGLALKP